MQRYSTRVRSPARRAWLGLALVLLLCIGGAARAQGRQVMLPSNAVYGELKAFQHPMARIGDRTLRLSPGARIFDTQNLIVQPGAVPQQASVMYRLDANGDISEIWLLTPEEAAAARQRKAQSG
jgi:hypothetical protein